MCLKRNCRVLRSAIEMLVVGVINLIEPELSKMSKMPWSTFENVGDQSEYVSNISKILTEQIPYIGDSIPRIHFKFFCDSLVLYVIFCVIKIIILQDICEWIYKLFIQVQEGYSICCSATAFRFDIAWKISQELGKYWIET